MSCVQTVIKRHGDFACFIAETFEFSYYKNDTNFHICVFAYALLCLLPTKTLILWARERESRVMEWMSKGHPGRDLFTLVSSNYCPATETGIMFCLPSRTESGLLPHAKQRAGYTMEKCLFYALK